ncbi:MAG TPA: XdhC family protein [Thermoanaerobaculia bacterium]|jgi:xanthine/CO dehydrogenase XdhC/CoxF family maturation factor
MSHEIDRLLDAVRSAERGILVTLVRTTGSTYRRPGARAVITEGGGACGLVSGGCIERDLRERMAEWMSGFTPRLVTYDSTTDADLVFGSGLGCRGTLELLVEPFDSAHPPAIAAFQWNGREPVVWTTRHGDRELLVEVIRPPRTIGVFGNGADVEPVIAIAERLGFNVARAFQPALEAAIVMTHNFLKDAELLEMLLPLPIPYIGVLGPKQRGAELVAHLSDEARAQAHRLRSPIGLDLGGDTPEEVALSVIAEVQAVLNGRDGRALQEREAPIHDPEQVWA